MHDMPAGQQFTWDNSSMNVNKPKNRYANVIAYDHSRVVLQPVDGVPGSDYINANYCDGYRKQNGYIATQVSYIIIISSVVAPNLEHVYPQGHMRNLKG